jgi:hypothetical protein
MFFSPFLRHKSVRWQSFHYRLTSTLSFDIPLSAAALVVHVRSFSGDTGNRRETILDDATPGKTPETLHLGARDRRQVGVLAHPHCDLR